MPSKGKASGKPKASDTGGAPKPSPPTPSLPLRTTTTTTTNTPTQTTTTTVLARSQQRHDAARPIDARLASKTTSLSALSPAEQTAWLAGRIASRLAKRPTPPASGGQQLGRIACGGGVKVLKEVWKGVNEGGLSLRVAKGGYWEGTKEGQLGVGAFEERLGAKVRLSALEVESRRFRGRREQEKRGGSVVTEGELDEERQRRKEMAHLRRELYGGGVGKQGKLALDPEWDDVVPVVLEEPEGALAAISYSDDYAEAMAYLRAVMQAKEYSPRCLRLTEHIIAMNPAHYTVWLYRAANVFALKLPILDEMEWLNGVALDNLKNYQIWHHRHLLVENYYPSIASNPDALATFAASERKFVHDILAEDTKNYHVWSYRSYLVGKLGMWDDAEELASVAAMVDDDVRNNSAWSHRFFLVFSNPAHATPGVASTEADPKAPPAVVDREIEYAKEKIALAPQNQSGWNYLRGVLVKGGRKLGSVEEFVGGFVKGLGEGEEAEDVLSTHALDLLAEIYAEKGEKEKADLSLRRLGQKWDRIRVGYWEWRRKCLEVPA